MSAARCCALLAVVLGTLLLRVHIARADSAVPIYADAGKKTGTGVLVRKGQDVWLVTAYHVVSGSAKITLSLAEGDPTVALQDVAAAGPNLCIAPTFELFAVKLDPQKLSSHGAGEPSPVSSAKVQQGVVVAVGNASQTILTQTRTLRNFVQTASIGGRMRTGDLKGIAAAAAADTRLLILSSQNITYGYSGGPLFKGGTAGGALQGIVLGGDSASGTVWALPGESIDQQLAACPGAERYQPDLKWPPPAFHAYLYSRLAPSSSAWELGLELGVDFLDRPWTQSAQRAVFAFGPVWRLPRARVGLTGGLGYALAAVDRRRLDPLQKRPLDTPSMDLIHGFRMQLGFDVRVPMRAHAEFRIGPGAYAEYFVFDMGEGSALGAERRWRSGLNLKGGFAYLRGAFSLLVSLMAGWERQPTFDRYYRGNLAEQDVLARHSGFVFGLASSVWWGL